MPIKQFQIKFKNSETPTILLPPDTGLKTIITVIEWLSKLSFPIIMGFPMKRKKLKKHVIARNYLTYSANDHNLPTSFQTLTSWAPYIIGLLQK